MARRRYDDDDDDDDRYEDEEERPRRRRRSRPRPSGGNSAGKIIAIVGGVVVALVVVCGGLGFFAVNRFFAGGANARDKVFDQMQSNARPGFEPNSSKSRVAASDFLNALTEQRYRDAYTKTTAGFKTRYATQVAFESFVKAHPELSLHDSLFPKELASDNLTTYHYEASSVGTGRLKRFTVTVTLDGADWKIDDIETE